MEYNIFMTKVVKKNKEVKGAKPRTILDNIADSLKRGANYEAYDKEIDKILGTEMQERDLEAEEAFELNNRRNDDPIS